MMSLLSGRLLAIVVNLCEGCGTTYTRRSICRACLHQADADDARKRTILLPAEFPD